MYKNRGMFLETIINKTIAFYAAHRLAYFEKKLVPVQVKFSQNQKQLIENQKLLKSTVDYFGVWQGRFVAFEAKSFHGSIFPFKNIKKHQHHYLQLINQYQGIAFYLLYSNSDENFYLISPKLITQAPRQHLDLKEIRKKGIQIELEFPGIIDFLAHLEKF